MHLSAVPSKDADLSRTLNCADLRIAIALEIFSWIGVHGDGAGRIARSPPRALITVPASVPD